MQWFWVFLVCSFFGVFFDLPEILFTERRNSEFHRIKLNRAIAIGGDLMLPTK